MVVHELFVGTFYKPVDPKYSPIVDKSGKSHSHEFVLTRVSTEFFRIDLCALSVCVYTYTLDAFRISDYPIIVVCVSRDKSDLIDAWPHVYGQNPRITKLVRNILTGGGLAS